MQACCELLADVEVRRDVSLFAAVKDYLAVEKGWFSPYLFASGRRPIIPRTVSPIAEGMR